MYSSTRFLVVAVMGVLLAAAAVAQDQPAHSLAYETGDPASWLPDLDAVIAAPENHRVLLENDRVRVLEVVVRPGEVEPLHHHRWPSTLYITEAGHFVDRNADGEVIFDTRQLDGPLPLPLTMWKEPEAPHTVENLSDTVSIRLLRVEVKPEAH
jgi:hypothetical protein